LTIAAVVAGVGAGVLAFRSREASVPSVAAPVNLFAFARPNGEPVAPTAAATTRDTSSFGPRDTQSETRLQWLRGAAGNTPSASAVAPAESAPVPATQATSEAASRPQRRSIAGVSVIVYTTSWCPVCRRAKDWLRGNGIAYEERDIETSSDNARKVRILNPRASIPTIDVDGEVLIGFSEPQMVAVLERAAQKRSERR
jgi:glutaredoxin